MANRRVTAFAALALLPAMLSAQSKPSSKADQDRIRQSAAKFSLDLSPSEDPPPPVTLNPPPTDPATAPAADEGVAAAPADATPTDAVPTDAVSDTSKGDTVPADMSTAPGDAAQGADDAAPDPAVTPPDAKPAADAATAAPEPSAEASPPVGAANMGPFSLDTPIVDLIADPRARKVLDKDMPGLSTDKNLDKFKYLSLRKFQPLTGGQLTDELLNSTGDDLAAISGDAPPAPKPSKTPVDER